jgi:hypothetical protein
MDVKQCYYLHRVDCFARKLLRSRFPLIQAVGGLLINFLMAYCYAIVMQVGKKEEDRRKKKKCQKRKTVPTVSKQSEKQKQTVRSAAATSK